MLLLLGNIKTLINFAHLKAMVKPLLPSSTAEKPFLDLVYPVPSSLLSIFQTQAQQKIQAEGWAQQGRHVEVKINNFVNCWTTEEAFKQILIKRKVWFRYRGLYFGDALGAGADFTVKIDGKECTLGLRSISADSLNKWKTVPYPDDRFQHEKEKIADFHVVCHNENGLVSFFGVISKAELLSELENAERKYSPQNQELFRVVPLEMFEFEELLRLLEKMTSI